MNTMKNNLWALVAVMGLALLSCSSDDDSGNQDTELFVRYTVSGTTYTYEDPVTAASANLTINGQIGLSGDGEYSSIAIWLPLEAGTGSYEFSGDFFEEGDYKLNLESEPLDIDGWATSGTLTLATVGTDYIEGTFTAVLENNSGQTVTLTDGEFKVYGIE